MLPLSFVRAESIDDALSLHDGSPDSLYLAGGTTLIDLMKLDVVRPRQVVDVNGAEADQIEVRPDGSVRIGALVRNSDLARNAYVRQHYPVLAEAILAGASSQLRNMATTGGNLLQRTRCSYFRDNVSPCNKRKPGSGCAAIEGYSRGHAIFGASESCIATHPSDMCVALAVLDALVVVQDASGARTIPFSEFHRIPGDTPWIESALEPGELVTAVILPSPPKSARSWYIKLRDRESFSFALASAAVLVSVEPESSVIRDVRIAFGGVATKPWRAIEAERRLLGASLEDEYARTEAAELAVRDAQPTQQNAFKVELVKRVLVRNLELLAKGQPAVRAT